MQTVLTRMPCDANSRDIAFVSAMPAARDIVVGPVAASGCFPPMLVTLMIRPPPASIMCGIASREHLSAPNSLVSKSPCHMASSVSSSGPPADSPALFTKMSIRLNRRTASSTNRSI